MKAGTEKKHTAETIQRKNQTDPGNHLQEFKKKKNESGSTQMKHWIIKTQMVPTTEKGK